MSDPKKPNISVATALLMTLVSAALALRDGLKAALDQIDQNHTAYADLQAKFDEANAKLAELQTHVDNEETLADEPELNDNITNLTSGATDGTGGDGTGGAGTGSGGGDGTQTGASAGQASG